LSWLGSIPDRPCTEGITRHLQNIAMGVRAIERNRPLKKEVTELNETFTALDGGFDSVGSA
jgi:hypothetical protein